MKKLLLPLVFLLSSCGIFHLNDIDEANLFYTKHKMNLTDEFDAFVSDTDMYGNKLLLSFILEDCSMCKEQFSYIKSYIKEHKDVAFKAIFVDELDEDENLLFESAFSKNEDFFIQAANAFKNSEYYLSLDEPNLPMPNDYNQLIFPINMFLDFTNNAPNYTSSNGVSEVCYGFHSINEIDDMVTHTGIF